MAGCADCPVLRSVAGVDWVKDMTAGWVRILSAAGEGSTPLDEAVQQINMIAGSPKKGRFRRDAGASAEASAVTVLSRQLVAGVLVSDLLLGQLCSQTGQAREQVLDQLIYGAPRQLRDQQVRALQTELSGSCAALRDPGRGSHDSLGSRIEEILRLAEQEASAILDRARAAAADITTSAGQQHPSGGAGQAGRIT